MRSPRFAIFRLADVRLICIVVGTEDDADEKSINSHQVCSRSSSTDLLSQIRKPIVISAQIQTHQRAPVICPSALGVETRPRRNDIIPSTYSSSSGNPSSSSSTSRSASDLHRTRSASVQIRLASSIIWCTLSSIFVLVLPHLPRRDELQQWAPHQSVSQ
ncbi:hypothetical protein ACLOJK_023476 [Asimina triloba]